MGLLAMALGVCYAFTQVAVTSVQIAANLSHGQEATAAAEAGIEEALYRLNAEPAWQGTTCVLDDSGTQFVVTAGIHPEDPWARQVTSVGQVFGQRGEASPPEVVAEKTVTATLRRAKATFSRYVVSTVHDDPGHLTCMNLYVYRPKKKKKKDQGQTEVQGDVQSNGDVYLETGVSVQGSVWATRRVRGSGDVTGEVYTDAGRLRRPLIDPASYRQYRLGQHVFDAQVLADQWLPAGEYGPVASNPMGVLYRHGSLAIDEAATIQGTVVVTGDLWLGSPDLAIRAREVSGAAFDYDVDDDGTPDTIRFPAVVAGGNVYLHGNGSRCEITGWVCSRGYVRRLHWTDDSRFRLTGGMLADGVYVYDSRRADFHAEHDPDGSDLRAAPGCFRWVVGAWQE